MGLRINTNINSLNAQRYLGFNSRLLSISQERLASGKRINRAADDAAGLQIANILTGQVRGLTQALQNTQDGLNVLGVVDGALQTIGDNLQRVRELTVQAANDTLGAAQRTAISTEIDQLRNDIDRIANSTQFNGVSLLGAAGVPANYFIQVGSNAVAANDKIDIVSALGNSTVAAGGLNLGAASVATSAAATAYLATVDTSIGTLNTKLGNVGAFSGRLQSAANFLSVNIENQSAALSRIRDADIATESANFTKYQILQQASIGMLAQANQQPSLALTLLGL